MNVCINSLLKAEKDNDLLAHVHTEIIVRITDNEKTWKIFPNSEQDPFFARQAQQCHKIVFCFTSTSILVVLWKSYSTWITLGPVHEAIKWGKNQSPGLACPSYLSLLPFGTLIKCAFVTHPIHNTVSLIIAARSFLLKAEPMWDVLSFSFLSSHSFTVLWEILLTFIKRYATFVPHTSKSCSGGVCCWPC